MATIAMVSAVFSGALVQRLSGIGFALISAPLLVLATTPYQGIRLANMLNVVVSVIVLATSFRDVDWRMARLLVPAGLLGVVPGVIFVRVLPSGPLQITVGAIVGVSLLAVVLVRRLHVRATPPRTIGAGIASGFTNAAAGVGGPALTVYAVVTAWPQEAFAATSQICFALQSSAALALGGMPRLSPVRLVLVLCAVVCGLAFGQLGARYVRGNRARHAAIVLATLGTAGALVKGIVS